jgi:carbonic anhydrase
VDLHNSLSPSCNAVKCGEVQCCGAEAPGKHWRKVAVAASACRTGKQRSQAAIDSLNRHNPMAEVIQTNLNRKLRPTGRSGCDKIVGEAMSGGVGA